MCLNILSGKFKKTSLLINNFKEYKNTSLIIKKIVFNWLSFNKINSCIDLFAGSGSLGFEIFSKYNCDLVLVEKNFINYKFLLKSKNKINSKKIKVYNSDAWSFIKNLKKLNKYDLIILDPPFINIKKILFYTQLIIKLLKINGKLFLETNINYNIINSFLSKKLDLINFKKIKKVNLFLYEIKKI